MAVIYIERSELNGVSEQIIKKIISNNSLSEMKYARLNDYYIGQHAILSHRKNDGMRICIYFRRR